MAMAMAMKSEFELAGEKSFFPHREHSRNKSKGQSLSLALYLRLIKNV
jgi:hypothetical protein